MNPKVEGLTLFMKASLRCLGVIASNRKPLRQTLPSAWICPVRSTITFTRCLSISVYFFSSFLFRERSVTENNKTPKVFSFKPRNSHASLIRLHLRQPGSYLAPFYSALWCFLVALQPRCLNCPTATGYITTPCSPFYGLLQSANAALAPDLQSVKQFMHRHKNQLARCVGAACQRQMREIFGSVMLKQFIFKQNRKSVTKSIRWPNFTNQTLAQVFICVGSSCHSRLELKLDFTLLWLPKQTYSWFMLSLSLFLFSLSLFFPSILPSLFLSPFLSSLSPTPCPHFRPSSVSSTCGSDFLLFVLPAQLRLFTTKKTKERNPSKVYCTLSPSAKLSGGAVCLNDARSQPGKDKSGGGHKMMTNSGGGQLVEILTASQTSEQRRESSKFLK